jgi:hypothetical protein
MAKLGEARPATESEVLAGEVEAVEVLVQSVRARYDQFFIGVEKRPPAREHDQLRARMLPLRTPTVRSAALGFRIQSLVQRVATYERLWARTLQEIENGTYRRDLFKARMRRQSSDKHVPPTAPAARPGAEARPEAQAVPASPAAPSRPPPEPVIHIAGARAGERVDPLSETRLRGVYQAYVEAKRRCNEDTAGVSFDSVAASLRKQVPDLLYRHRVADVEYRVFVKDGRAVLRAVPKA